MGNLWDSVKSNLLFIGVIILAFLIIYAAAKLFEHFAMPKQTKARGARRIAYIGMFSAIAGVLMMLEIPLFFAPSFYKIDLSELPVLLCSFYLGPVAGVTAEFLKVIIKLLLKGTSTAFVGDFANFFVGCCFVLPASMLYHRHKTKKGSVVAMILGTLVMTVAGSFFNAFYLIPKFSELFGLPLDVIVSMGTSVNSHITSVSTLVLFAVVPFNLLKGVIDSILCFLLYKRLEKVFFKENRPENSGRKG